MLQYRAILFSIQSNSYATTPLKVPFTVAESSTCTTGMILPAAATCNIDITFDPTSADVSEEGMSLSYNNGVSDVLAVRKMKGSSQSVSTSTTTTTTTTTTDEATTTTTTTILRASLAMTPTGAFTYPDTYTYGTSHETFTITNSGTGAAVLGTVSTAGLQLAAPFFLKDDSTCATGAVLAAGASCTLKIDFTLTYTAATFSDTIVFSFNDGEQDTSISKVITGTGIEI